MSIPEWHACWTAACLISPPPCVLLPHSSASHRYIPLQFAGKASTSKEPAAASQPPNGAPDLPKPTGGSADAPQPMDGVSQPPDAPIKPVDSAFDAQLKQLDLQLLYLWRAHGVDYYAGQEVFSYESPKMPPAGKPLQRCTRPEEGEQAAEGEGAWLAVPLHLSFSCLHWCTCVRACIVRLSCGNRRSCACVCMRGPVLREK